MRAFDRLHPALQHHIVNSLGWRSLRPVQEQAIEAVLDGENIVVLAPTAGGKTEAAFFPLISQMLLESWSGLSVIYVSPIKALLNNQEYRLSRYFGLVGRRIGVRHGDITVGEKARLAADPPDCLLTTPESLEVMLVSPNVPHARVFQAVRAVVVDEVHAFANDDRGWHLLSVLERVARIAGRDIQRLGLSATVGNAEDVVRWLTAGSRRACRVVNPGIQDTRKPQVEIDYVGSIENAATVIQSLHVGEKRLVFCDSRSRVELLSAKLREGGTQTYVSHSSIGVEERRDAERAFAQGQNCVIVATSALELGIDVGDLDRVIQIDAPGTVSSFLQRMGRTGRRPETQRNCLFLATSNEGLLRAAGLVDLWEGGYVEPVSPPPEPWHVLAQQLMALALQERGIARNSWLEWVRGVPAFASLPQDQIDTLVRRMLEKEILWEDAGVLWLGRRGEETYGRKNFLEIFSVFSSPPLFEVRHGNVELGNVHESTFVLKEESPAVLLLAGRSWRVRHVDWKRKIAQVEPVKEEGRSLWKGEGQLLSFALCQAIQGVLARPGELTGLSQRARKAIAETRETYDWVRQGMTTLRSSEDGRVEWWTFAGGRANACLAPTLEAATGNTATFDNFTVRFKGTAELLAIHRAIEEMRKVDAASLHPRIDDAGMEGLKFAACLPREAAMEMLGRRMRDVAGGRGVLGRGMECVTGGGGGGIGVNLRSSV